MIPNFPEFVEVSIENKDDIELYTHKFIPYSDFNFVSLYAWDTENKRKVAVLDGGLAVLMTDYDTGEPLLSFLGKVSKIDTIFDLINHSEELGIGSSLHFIGEETVADIDDDRIVVEEDRGHFDYILSVPQLTELKGREYASKRHLANRFERDYPKAIFETTKLNNSLFETHALPILTIETSGDLNEDNTHEREAIERLFRNIESENLILSTLFTGNQLVAFSIDEILPNKYAISHFFKANYAFNGVTEFMNKKVAEHLQSLEVEFWNWEQDLGLESLKKMKTGYRPIKFLKKYKISLK